MFDPEDYDRYKKLSNRSFTQNPVHKLTNGMKWNPKEVILDYGCGTGTVTNKRFEPLATLHDSFIHGVDISASMIEYAKRKHPSPRTQYQVGNIMDPDFPFPAQYFDKIFAIHVFNWIPDFREGLLRFFSLLKPGGYFGVLVGSGGYFQNKLLQCIAQDPKWSGFMEGYEQFNYMKMYDYPELVESSYRQSLLDIGFRILELTTITEGTDPVNMERLARFYISLNPYLPRIPTEVRAKLEHDYTKYNNQQLRCYSEKTEDKLVLHEHQLLFFIVQKPYNLL